MAWHGTGVNTLRPRQNGCHFADDIFICIFLHEYVWILIKISLKFVPTVWINNIPVLVQIVAWRWPGNKPLSEPMLVKLPTHLYASLGLNELSYVASNQWWLRLLKYIFWTRYLHYRHDATNHYRHGATRFNKFKQKKKKWLPFCSWHFQTHFLEWKLLCFDALKFVPKVYNQQYAITGSTMVLTNHYLEQWCLVYWCIYLSLGPNESIAF